MLSRDTRPTPNRRHRSVTALVVLLLAMLAAAPGHSAAKAKRGRVSGTVTSHAGGEPLAGVAVALEASDGTRATTTTDRGGRFSIKVLAGDYVISLEREGYARFEVPLTVEADGGKVVTVELLDASEGKRNEAVAAYNAGGDALRAGDTAAAKASFLAAVEADPTLPEPHQVLAGIYFEEGAWSEAAQAADTFLAARPGDRRTQLTAYEAHRKLANKSRVVEIRSELAADPELAPKLAVHAFNEGVLADKDGDGDTAVSRFHEALQLDATLAAVHFALATREYEAERYDEALASAKKGLELEPASAQGRRLIFSSLDAGGDAEAAAEALDAYAEVDADGAVGILVKRGEAGFLDGDYVAAKRVLMKALEYQPDHAHTHRLLGLVLLSSDEELAKEHLGRFLELAPDDPEAATVREVLGAL